MQHLKDAGAVVYGTSRRANRLNDDNILKIDLAEATDINVALPKVDVAVFCAAMARFADCRKHPELARTINVTSPTILAKRLAAQGSHNVLLSTSAIFDSSAPHTDQPANPMASSVYGRLKMECESAFRRVSPTATIFRLTKVVDRNSELLFAWKAALLRGETVEAFVDQYFSPLEMGDVVSALMYTIEHRIEGPVQISGREDISYFDAACHIAKRVTGSTESVVGVPAIKGGLHPGDTQRYTAMDCSRLNDLTGYKPEDAAIVLDRVLDLGS